MITREEVIIDELYVHIINLAYHWEKGIYINFQCDKQEAGGLLQRAQQNKPLLALLLLTTLDKEDYSLVGKNKDMLRWAKEYVRKYIELYKINPHVWDDTFFSRLAEVLQRIISKNTNT